MRKLYLTQTKFSHFSQFAEDISIARLFDKNYKGFFVDVGCFHPKKYNNTWRLYKRGWRGINIDIDSIKIAGFNLVRSKDVNISCAISDTEGELTYYSNGFYSLTISLDESFVKNNVKGKNYIKKTTPTKKLTTILDESKYKDKQIDFLSIDAEAHDLEVLMSLDIERYNPKLIAVETHFALFTEVTESPLYQYLLSKGYCLVGWCGLTLLMVNQSFQQKLASKKD